MQHLSQGGQITIIPDICIVTPALKKPVLDPSDMKKYRPISNLSFISKVLEWIVVWQLSEYLAANSLLYKLQSGFRRHHSTESFLLWVLSHLFTATDKGEVSLLALLDVSAAFDTVDHSILLADCTFHMASLDWQLYFLYYTSVSQRLVLGTLVLISFESWSWANLARCMPKPNTARPNKSSFQGIS